MKKTSRPKTCWDSGQNDADCNIHGQRQYVIYRLGGPNSFSLYGPTKAAKYLFNYFRILIAKYPDVFPFFFSLGARGFLKKSREPARRGETDRQVGRQAGRQAGRGVRERGEKTSGCPQQLIDLTAIDLN